MEPHVRARAVARRWESSVIESDNVNDLAADIEAAITAAVTAERNRCATIARAVAAAKDRPDVGMDCCADTAAAIEHAINRN